MMAIMMTTATTIPTIFTMNTIVSNNIRRQFSLGDELPVQWLTKLPWKFARARREGLRSCSG